MHIYICVCDIYVCVYMGKESLNYSKAFGHNSDFLRPIY